MTLSALAAAAASRAVPGLRLIVPAIFSVFSQATSDPLWTVDPTGRTTSATQNGSSPSTSSLATVARGSGGGVWQVEFTFPVLSPGSFASVLVGMGKAGRYSTGAIGEDTTAPSSDDGFAANLVGGTNSGVFHAVSGAAPGIGGGWTTTTVIGLILDASNPSNYLVSMYKDTGALFKAWSTTIGLGATQTTPDLTGDYYPGVGWTGLDDPGTTITAFINSGQEAFKKFVAGAAPWGR